MDDYYEAPNWVSDALSTADRVTGVMNDINCGMMSLYVLLTYAGENEKDIDVTHAEYVHEKLKDEEVYAYDDDMNVVKVAFGFSAGDIIKRSRCVKLAVINFMKYHGYVFTADDYEKYSPAITPKPTRWWTEVVPWNQKWERTKANSGVAMYRIDDFEKPLVGDMGSFAASVVKPVRIDR
jgi:hypothetical protein